MAGKIELSVTGNRLVRSGGTANRRALSKKALA
jgi:hypothetical protein